MTRKTPPDPADKFDDEDYPAYTMGRAAEMIGATPAFLRAVGEARLITPLRSAATAATPVTSSGWPHAPGNWSTRARPSRPPAAS